MANAVRHSREAETEEEIQECIKQASCSKIIFGNGPPGTGKTYVVHREIKKWKRKGARILFVVPTGQLASEIRSIHPDIDVDTCHGGLLLHRPLRPYKAFRRPHQTI